MQPNAVNIMNVFGANELLAFKNAVGRSSTEIWERFIGRLWFYASKSIIVQGNKNIEIYSVKRSII